MRIVNRAEFFRPAILENMMQDGQFYDGGSNFDLLEICLILWRHKWFLLGIVTICTVLAGFFVLLSTKLYRADVLLKPSDSKAPSGLATQLGGLSGLASIAGINVANSTSAEPISVLTSREFTGAFISDENILPLLSARVDGSPFRKWVPASLVRKFDLRDAVIYFNKKIRAVQEDKKTGFVTMSIEWVDPVVAAEWANLLVTRLNERMRSRALSEAELNVAYLKQELASANVVTLQQSIGHVLETELQKLMLARVSKEYSFKVLDPAEPPKFPSSPRQLLILGSTGFLSALLCSVLILMRHVMLQNRRLRA